MRIIVASDFHLKFCENEEDLSRRKRVISFLKSLIGKVDVLILGGDVFDLWFSWQSVIIKGYFPLLKVLADIKENDCKIILTAGNHDFWFGDFLQNYVGIEIYANEFCNTIDGKKIYVAHGDQYTTSDMRYHIFRKIIRNRTVMKIFEFLHPDLALGFGKVLSRSSRDAKRSPEIMKRKEQGLINKAKELIENGYDLVFFGHSHSPMKVDFSSGTYYNTGDWIANNSYVEIIDGNHKLCYYKKQ